MSDFRIFNSLLQQTYLITDPSSICLLSECSPQPDPALHCCIPVSNQTPWKAQPGHTDGEGGPQSSPVYSAAVESLLRKVQCLSDAGTRIVIASRPF